MSLAELLVATTIVVTVLGTTLGLVDRAMRTFDVQTELADVQQRQRVGVALLQSDLGMAVVPVRPFRAGLERPDPPGSFHADVITLDRVRPDATSEAQRRVYYMQGDELMRYDGEHTDIPVLDHVVSLEFRYFADGEAALPAAVLSDGPWHPDAADPDRMDADLLRVRRIRVALRVQASVPWLRGQDTALFANPGTARPGRQVADQEIEFDVALRNLPGPP